MSSQATDTALTSLTEGMLPALYRSPIMPRITTSKTWEGKGHTQEISTAARAQDPSREAMIISPRLP
ncbi:hypothetical protein SY2F82_15020 [Streptomyces sp. Y2F8-2]|nr:hypothetical protein SY2F82_15020 [Streptomyces sp. Y2F8-2]